MGKTYTAKTLSGDFKITIPENPLLSKQAVTSRGISVPYTNLQLNSYPNTQLNLFCSDNLSFSMHSSQYVTNQSMRGSQYAAYSFAWIQVHDWHTNLRRMLAAKFFNSSTRWRSRSSLVTKPNNIQNAAASSEKGWTKADVFGHNMLVKNLCIKFHTLLSSVTALKIILIYV